MIHRKLEGCGHEFEFEVSECPEPIEKNSRTGKWEKLPDLETCTRETILPFVPEYALDYFTHYLAEGESPGWAYLLAECRAASCTADMHLRALEKLTGEKRMSFIFTDEEYEVAKRCVRLAEENFEAERARLAEAGYGEAAQKMLQTAGYTRLQMQKEEIEIYENLKDGKLPESSEIVRLPRMLTCMRIASGLSQNDLAAKLGLEGKQLKRMEYNEHHGVTSLVAQEVIDALPVNVTIVVEDIDTGAELSDVAVKDLGLTLKVLKRAKGISFEQLYHRLKEESALVKSKDRQDYMDCVMANLDVADFTSVARATDSGKNAGVSMTYAAIMARALKVKLTVKAKLTK